MSYDEIESGPRGMLKWVLLFIIFITITVGVLHNLGLIGSTVVERKVFENSFQYKEGMEQRAAILEANLLEAKINLTKDPANEDLQNQVKLLEAQIRAITINQ